MCLIRHFLFAFALIQLHFLVSDADTLDAEIANSQWNEGQTGTVSLDYPGQTLYYYVENHGGTDDGGKNQDMTVKLCYDDGNCINECSTSIMSNLCSGSTCIDNNDNPNSLCVSSSYSSCSSKACSGTVQNLPTGTTTLSYKCDASGRSDNTCHFKLVVKTTYASPPPPPISSPPPPPISSPPPTTTTTTSGDCECNCCKGNSCSASSVGFFNAGSLSSCSNDACRTQFPSSCPASGSSGQVASSYSVDDSSSTSYSSTPSSGIALTGLLGLTSAIIVTLVLA